MDGSPSILCHFSHLTINSKLITILVKTGIASSKGDARRKLEQNQFALNNKKNKVKANHRMSLDDIKSVSPCITIVWIGKNNFRTIVWTWLAKDFQVVNFGIAKKRIISKRPKPVVDPLLSNPLFIKWRKVFPNSVVPPSDMFEDTFKSKMDIKKGFWNKEQFLKLAEIHPFVLNMSDEEFEFHFDEKPPWNRDLSRERLFNLSNKHKPSQAWFNNDESKPF